MRIDELPSPLARVGGSPGAASSNVGAQAFIRAMEQARAAQDASSAGAANAMRVVKPQDTLGQIVRQEILGRGIELDANQHYQAVLAVARDNQLASPDRVKAGQTLNLSQLHARLDQVELIKQGRLPVNPAPGQAGTSPTTPTSTNNPTIQNAAALATSTQTAAAGTAKTQSASNPSARSVSAPDTRTVLTHDTLSQIVRQEARGRGVQLSPAQAYKAVLSLAKDNQIDNPDHILVGQQLKLGQLRAELSNPSSEIYAATEASAKRLEKGQAKLALVDSARASKPVPAPEPHPVLRQTLQRAVARGFIPANEQQDVYNKILQVANKHRFAPDDFARLTLMESDGMNPQASNQRCHGIIQFCDGPARGAASVGYAQAPKAILNLSVYQQLHLVDTYFDQVGLKKQGRVQLDELYLAVLQPAARAETRPEVPLEIPGSQAHALYEGRNPQGSITRSSIVQGLLKNTLDRLSNTVKPAGSQISSSQPTPAPQTPPASAFQPISYQEKM